MLSEEVQDGHHGGHLGYWKGTILAILNLYVTLMPYIKFRLNLMVWEEMSFEEFQDGHCDASQEGHLGYRNRMILAILKLCVTMMPPIKFQLNWTSGLGGVI